MGNYVKGQKMLRLNYCGRKIYQNEKQHPPKLSPVGRNDYDRSQRKNTNGRRIKIISMAVFTNGKQII